MPTTELYTLSLHDALPISRGYGGADSESALAIAVRQNTLFVGGKISGTVDFGAGPKSCLDRKSTRLNSSHTVMSYAVFCLKKKTAGLYAALVPVSERPWMR